MAMLWRALTHINNRRDINTLGQQITRGAMAIVIIGKDCNALRRRYSPSVGIAAQGTRLHDPRAVIIGKGDGALDCTSA